MEASVLRIEKFLDQPDTMIRMEEFAMAGHKWYLEVHPNARAVGVRLLM